MAANNSCTQDTTISGTSIFTRGNTGELGNPRGFMNFSNVRYLPSFLAFLLFASFLSSFAIGEIVRDTQNVNSNHVVNNRTEHTLRRMFGNRSEILYKSSNNNGGSKAGAGESRICPIDYGSREIVDERGRRKERSNDRTRTTGRMNGRDSGRAWNSGCTRDETRSTLLEVIKQNLLLKLGMSEPPDLKGKTLPKIGHQQLAALLNRRHLQKGGENVVWVVHEDGIERNEDDPYGDLNNKSNLLRYDSDEMDSFEEDEAYVDEEDDYHVRTEKVVTFSRTRKLVVSDPRVKNYPNVQYFQFSDKIRSSRVKKAILWIYIKGSESVIAAGDKITISIYKVLHKENGPRSLSQRLLHHSHPSLSRSQVRTAPAANSSRESPVIMTVLKDLTQYIPKGEGAWITLDYLEIKNLVSEWFAHPAKNLGIIISAEDANKTNLAVTSLTGNNTTYVPFLELYVADNVKHRTKRALGLNCNQSSNETRCCRYPLTVNFQEFGWDWIIAPKTYDAYACLGECPFVFLTQYPHTHVLQLANVPGVGPCCSPRKLSDIYMIYFDQNMNINQGMVPGMAVERCGCD